MVDLLESKYRPSWSNVSPLQVQTLLESNQSWPVTRTVEVFGFSNKLNPDVFNLMREDFSFERKYFKKVGELV